MLGFIVGLLIIGLIVGFLARAIVPGPDPMGIGATILLGIGGSAIGGFLADALFRSDAEDRGFGGVGLIGATIGAIILLLIFRAVDNGRGVGNGAR